MNSEETLGKILEGRRKNVIVASKFGTRVPEYKGPDVEVSLLQTLQKLRTDYLDLYQVSKMKEHKYRNLSNYPY